MSWTVDNIPQIKVVDGVEVPLSQEEKLAIVEDWNNQPSQFENSLNVLPLYLVGFFL